MLMSARGSRAPPERYPFWTGDDDAFWRTLPMAMTYRWTYELRPPPTSDQVRMTVDLTIEIAIGSRDSNLVRPTTSPASPGRGRVKIS